MKRRPQMIRRVVMLLLLSPAAAVLAAERSAKSQEPIVREESSPAILYWADPTMKLPLWVAKSKAVTSEGALNTDLVGSEIRDSIADLLETRRREAARRPAEAK